jgi:hypothetical protein
MVQKCGCYKMAELAKKLYIKKGTTQQTAKIYSTTTEAGNAYIHLIVDGVHVYMPLGSTTDNRATLGRVKESSGTQFAILSSGKSPYHKDSYTSPGTYTWTCPAGVTTARVTVAGGGSGGYQGVVGINSAGGSGALVINTVSVSPNSTYTIVVGVGGAGGKSNSYPHDGGTSSALGILAQGGKALNGSNSAVSYGNGGAGGAAGNNYGSPGWIYIEYGGDI